MRSSSDRFSGQNLLDCEFCTRRGEHARLYRTQRVCAGCGKPLCMVCRPPAPRTPSRCPDCDGGELQDAVANPIAAAEAMAAAGKAIPFWLQVMRDRAAEGAADELAAPE